MSKIKALTQIPMGTIKRFIDENFNNVKFTKEAINFFENEFLGDIDSFSQLVHLKDGNTKDVKEWLKKEYDIKIELEGDYAIAAVLALLLSFKERATFKTIKNKNKEFAGGLHKKCKLFKFENQNIFQLSLKNKEYDIFISEEKIDNEIFNNESAFQKKVLLQDTLTNLTLPLVEYKEEINYSDLFKGSTMISNKNGKEYTIQDSKTLTIMDFGLDDVKIKQAAVVSMMLSGCSSFEYILEHTIKKDFFIYVRYNQKLLFASKMLEEDFIKGDELEKLKTEEKKSIENSKQEHKKIMEDFENKLKSTS